MDVLSIIEQFEIVGEPTKAELYGRGHINDSFKVLVDDSQNPGYLLQKVNHAVFPDIEGLMENIDRVTVHLREKAEDKDSILRIIPANDGQLFYKNQFGSWRVFKFLKDVQSFEKAQTPEHAYEAAKAFGTFVKNLSAYPVTELNTTIPNFHNMRFRLQQFHEALEGTDSENVELAKTEIAYVQEVGEAMLEIYDASANSNIPIRVTHNDTKLNNVLFNASGKAQSVIDLDTVMPGYVYYDIGDGVRTGVVGTEEDEADLEKVQIDMEKYRAYLTGYLEATKDILTPAEVELIPKAGPYMAFIMGLRFLADFLNGNVYFKIKFPKHNLQRARCQLYVTKLLLEVKAEVEKIVRVR